MATYKIKIILVWLTFIFPLSTLLSAAALQGKLIRFGPGGILPAPFVTVTINPLNSDKILKTEQTYDNGIYYFTECQPGNYILKIWGKGKDGKSLDFNVEISEQPVTNIAPILIHSLRFIYPKKEQTIVEETDIRVRGTHYNIPDDAFVWIVLKNTNGNFYLTTKYPVLIRPDQTWESRLIHIIEGTTDILTVLVTKSDNDDFRRKATSDFWSYDSKLPRNAHKIASRKINLISPPNKKTSDDVE